MSLREMHWKLEIFPQDTRTQHIRCYISSSTRTKFAGHTRDVAEGVVHATLASAAGPVSGNELPARRTQFARRDASLIDLILVLSGGAHGAAALL